MVIMQTALFHINVNAQKTDYFMGEVVNYDETAVPTYTLPSLLIRSNGKRVKNVRVWEKERKPEIISLFKQYVYGQTPAGFDSIRFDVTKLQPGAMQGTATLKEIMIHLWNKGKHAHFSVTLFIPNGHNKPAPVFLLINNRSKKNTDPTRLIKSPFWPAELLIEQGYAIASFQVSDVAPDNKDLYRHGVLDQLFPELLVREDGMKAIGTWAWAASRVMDYFETDKQLNAGQVVLVGHSRGGKTALWAAALDDRFAIVCSSCSGSTGAAIARRQYGETVSLINKQFGYWFADTYKQYSSRVNDLPVDQHMLIALIAPRAVYTTNATGDRWADPLGSYLSLVNALPVYRLYGNKTGITPEPPAANTPIIQSTLGYHLRTGIHDMNLVDWQNFIRFADYHFKRNEQTLFE